MWSTALMIAAAVVVLWMLLKFKEVRHRAFGAVLIIMLLIFFLSASHIVKTQNINLKESGGIPKFFSAYVVWIGQAFGNIKSITGDAVGMDWGLEENVSVQEMPQEESKVGGN